MPLILPSNSISAVGYEVDNSLRFDNGSSDYLNRTPGSASNRRTFTFSSWIKRSALSNFFSILGGNSGSNGNYLVWWNDDTLAFSDYNGVDFIVRTNAQFRDVSAWYHLVLSVDSTQGTAANRIKIYVNGVQETSLAQSSYPSQNYDFEINNNVIQYVGHNSYNYMNGYMAETVLIDGSQLDPTSFGEFDSATGIWKPKAVSGLTFGTNGFYLPFENSGALGQDDSGNGNNFTVNNLTSIDQTTDTPTNNFATMNPLDNYAPESTFSEGNLKITTGGLNIYSFNNSTIAVSQGKWYCEIKWISNTADWGMTGISALSPVYYRSAPWGELGDSAYAWSYQAGDGTHRNNNTNTAYGDTYSDNDIIGIYLDLDNNKLYFAKNGTIQNSGTGISITDPASTPTGHYFFSAGNYQVNNAVFEINFGNPTFSISSGNSDPNGYGNFEYNPSAGTFDGVSKNFYALNTKNLTEFG